MVFSKDSTKSGNQGIREYPHLFWFVNHTNLGTALIETVVTGESLYILFFCFFGLFSFFVFSVSNSDLVQPQLVVVEATKAMLTYTMVAVEYQYSLKVTTDLVYATALNLNLTEMPF